MEKKSEFVDSGFVVRSHELLIIHQGGRETRYPLINGILVHDFLPY